MLHQYHAKLRDVTMANFQDKPDEVNSIRILNSTQNLVEIEWDEPCSNNSNITGYTIYLNDEVLIEGLNELFHVIENLQPKNVYKIQVVATSDQGDGYKSKQPTLVQT